MLQHFQGKYTASSPSPTRVCLERRHPIPYDAAASRSARAKTVCSFVTGHIPLCASIAKHKRLSGELLWSSAARRERQTTKKAGIQGGKRIVHQEGRGKGGRDCKHRMQDSCIEGREGSGLGIAFWKETARPARGQVTSRSGSGCRREEAEVATRTNEKGKLKRKRQEGCVARGGCWAATSG